MFKMYRGTDREKEEKKWKDSLQNRITSSELCMTVPGAPKSSPLKHLANVSRTIEIMTKVFTLITHLIIRKSGKFHY